MSSGEPIPFSLLLRRARREAGLTQEALAERARLSWRAISDLERGVNRPRADTLALLLGALPLADDERAAFETAASRSTAGSVTASSAAALMPAAAPPLTNLPRPSTTLIGREREVAVATEMLRREDLALLTLTGAGGVGKTRLALEVARQLLPAYADGAWLVELAPLRDHTLVAGAITHALGVLEATGETLHDSLLAYLREKHLLLLLDNVEHLPRAAPLVAELLAVCPQVTVLATSRAPLRVHGEQQLPVPPLALPDPARLHSVEQLASVPAVALFARQARAARPDFVLTKVNAAAVAEICRRLDGLPLAIELAAARVTLLSPTALLTRLERRLTLLTGGPADASARQRTLLAAITWSHDLLHPAEQALFRRLAVFAGGCTQAAVEAVCQVGNTLEGDLLDWLGSLVNKSLLQVAWDGEEPRFGMLETIREYALELLAASGDAETVHQRHATHYLSLLEAVVPRLTGPVEVAWPMLLEAEHYNLRAAVQWARTWWETAPDEADELLTAYAEGRWGILLRLGGRYEEANTALERAAGSFARRAAWDEMAGTLAQIGRLYEVRIMPRESVARLEHWLEPLEAYGPSPGLAALYIALASNLFGSGWYARQLQAANRAVDLARALGDDWLLSEATHFRAVALGRLGQTDAQLAVLAEVISLAEVGNHHSLLLALGDTSDVYARRGQFAEAQVYNERAVLAAEQLAAPEWIAWNTAARGHLAWYMGNWTQARADLEQTIALRGRTGTSLAVAFGLAFFGWHCLHEGAWEEADRYLEESARIADRTGEPQLMRNACLGLAMRDLLIGRTAAARDRLLGALDRIGWEAGFALPLLPLLARAYVDLGEIARAEEVLGQADRRAQAEPHWLVVVDILHVRVLLAIREGHWDHAFQALEEGLALTQRMPYPFAQGSFLRLYGEVHRRRQEPGPARERLMGALTIFTRLGAAWYIQLVTRDIADLR